MTNRFVHLSTNIRKNLYCAVVTCVLATACGDQGTAPGEPCQPSVTCSSVGAECGAINDGCGRFIDCGACNGSLGCGADEVFKCGCTPVTCESVGANCGAIDDGCGSAIECGQCAAPEQCGAAGIPHVCASPICIPPFCYEAPYPQADDLYGAFVDPAGQRWLVGEDMILRGGPYAWSGVDGYTRYPALIKALWMFADGDGWAVGAGTRGALLRFNGNFFDCSDPAGKFWAKLDEQTDIIWDLHDLWATSPSNVWAVGEKGIIHFDGSAWSVAHSTDRIAELFAISGRSDKDIWALGRAPQEQSFVPYALHYNGASWERVHVYLGSVMAELRAAVLTPETGDLWVAGAELDAQGKVVASLVGRYREGRWRRYETGTTERLHAVSYLAEASPVFAGERGSFLQLDGAGLYGRSGLFGTSDLHGLHHYQGGYQGGSLLAGAHGFIAELRGGLWWPNRAVVPPGPTGEGVVMWQRTPDDLWAGGSGWVMRYNGIRWGVAAVPLTVTGIFGVAPDKIWLGGVADGQGRVLRYDGQRFFAVASTSAAVVELQGSSSTDVRATLSDGAVLHYDGSSWQTRDSLAFAAAPTSVPVKPGWSLDPVTGFSHHEGDPPKSQRIYPYEGLESEVFTAWGSSPTDVWAAGRDAVVHYDGSAWSRSSVQGTIADMVGSGPHDIWLVGKNGGPLWHFDGEALSAQPFAQEDTLSCVDLSPAGDLYVGGSKLYRRRAGSSSFEPVLDGLSDPVALVVAATDDELWAAAGPTLYHYVDDRWESMPAWDLFAYLPTNSPAQQVWLHGAHKQGDTIAFIGTTPEREAAMLLVRHGDQWTSTLPLQAYDQSVFTDVWVGAAERIYVTKGEVGYVYIFDATDSNPMFNHVWPTTARALGALWAHDKTMWVFGPYGAILRAQFP